MTDLSVLFQLYNDLPKDEQVKFLKSLRAKTEVSPSEPQKDSKEDYLKQVRFKSEITCPHCSSKRIVKNGRYNGSQRYLCKDCRKTFNVATNSLLSFTKKPLSVWRKYIHCMIEKKTIRQCAKECGLSVKASFNWRHKILDALQNMASNVNLNGIIEADETFFRLSFKGNHRRFKLPRQSYKRGTKATKRGLSKEQVCVPCAVNRDGLSVAKISNLGKPSVLSLRKVFDGRMIEDSVLVTDKNYSYSLLSELSNLNLVQIKGGKRSKGIFNIQHINNYHSRLKGFMRPFHGVATKYLNNYLIWHNLVNYAKETLEEKEVIMRDFVCSTVTKTRSMTLSKRNPVPVLV